MDRLLLKSWVVLTILILLFSNIPLTSFAAIGPGGESEDWSFGAFGSNTGEDKNPPPTFNEDGSITLEASGGKIASSEEGLSFYYKKLTAESNFEISTTVHADAYSPDSQRAFGLMLRDEVGENGDSGKQASNYIAVGGLDDKLRGFYSQGGLSKLDAFAGNVAPVSGETYELSIKKSGDTFRVTSNGHSETLSLEGAFNEDLYVGLFVARDGIITFSDTHIEQTENVDGLKIDTSNIDDEYLIDEPLDLERLEVTAVLEDGTELNLAKEDYIVTGFDSSEAGTNTITISYGGVEETISLKIKEIQLTDLYIKYYPAKTDYYVQDSFETKGLEVVGVYESGYTEETLSSEQYSCMLGGELIQSGAALMEAGTKEITIQSTQSPEITTEFEVEVKDEQVTELEVTQLPSKTQYFSGEELDLDGLSVEALYTDGEKVRVMKDQLEVSGLDTSMTGDQQIELSYKGVEVSFLVNVKEKERQGVKVTTYPKTTYQVGEEFDSSELKVSEVFDNGDETVLDETEYELDKTAFDASQTGVYPIVIRPTDDTIEPLEFEVTVRDQTDPEWKTIQFGQSTGSDTNYVVEEEDHVQVVAEPGAGKITGDHDGITFYYTEIEAGEDNFELSADIKVNEYAKSPNHDGQESFGLMARDVIGENDSSSVFASNIAAVGGFSGGTQEENGTQLFIRTGVESSDGAGSQGIQKIMLNDEKPDKSNTHPEQEYRLTLSKTNRGYRGQWNDGEEEIFFNPEILNVQDSKVYVGFYAARLADIEVSNIDYSVTASATDPPKVEAPEHPVNPEFHVESRARTSETGYELLLESNVDGVATIKQGLETIEQGKRINKGEVAAISAELSVKDRTDFSITFLPDDTQFLTSYEKQVQNFTVTHQTFRSGEPIHVTPSGTSDGTGTENEPLDLDTAVEYVLPGQKIILAGGEYVRDSKLEISKYNDGTEEARKYLVAADGESPVINFDKKSEGVVLSGNYWHVKGIDFKRSAGNTKGFTIGGNHNIVEESRFYENGDTGVQISRTNSDTPKEEWPSHNLILNSESFDNRDPSDNNADGFAAKLTSGDGNIFRGCVAHHNIDDGWDLYTKAGTGAIGSVLIEDSIAYENGTLTDGTVGDGDKNGFKLGGEGIHVPHIIRNSLAFHNGADGFTSNSNPGVIADDNLSFNNAGRNLSFTTYPNIEEDFTVDGFISYQTGDGGEDQYPEEVEADDNFFFDGEVSINKSGVTLTDENFGSLAPDLPFDRKEDGELIRGEFMKFHVFATVDWKPPVIKQFKGKGHKKHDQKGPKATAYLSIQEGVDLENIRLDTLLVNGEVKPLDKQKKKQIADFDKDGIDEYRVDFSRNQLASILEKGAQEITLSGELESGLPIEAASTIYVK
ncbi:bacterial Ig-like domain-containing protein [Halobacillus litoralis]|uniref:Exopolygalacturonate lyase n=1 Tax=Halobacillus litoralis TaxID=45668 RepID=A0A410MBP2_9BACI|nr:bacterial Ig-like domain-containing protein [Halobacillus litoralis]QAS52182.1 exopolygalacturonate lyase [Halobacillus litoralis]